MPGLKAGEESQRVERGLICESETGAGVVRDRRPLQSLHGQPCPAGGAELTVQEIWAIIGPEEEVAGKPAKLAPDPFRPGGLLDPVDGRGVALSRSTGGFVAVLLRDPEEAVVLRAGQVGRRMVGFSGPHVGTIHEHDVKPLPGQTVRRTHTGDPGPHHADIAGGILREGGVAGDLGRLSPQGVVHGGSFRSDSPAAGARSAPDDQYQIRSPATNSTSSTSLPSSRARSAVSPNFRPQTTPTYGANSRTIS